MDDRERGMGEQAKPGVYRFEGWTFDPTSGDLERPDGDRARLRPQAATLFRLLLEAEGKVVSRDEIRDTVWAGTVVEFDQGMNACVSEIRRALGDQPANPRFVETLPRRGYRFLPDLVPPSGETPARKGAAAPGRRAKAWLLAVATAVVVTGLWAAFLRSPDGDSSAPTLLVLPFRNATTGTTADTLAAILSEQLIAELARVDPGVLSVIASASSRRFATAADPVSAAERDLDLDMIVEGSVAWEGGFTLDVRVIASETRRRIWAGRYPLDPADLSGTAAAAAFDVLEAVDPTAVLPRPRHDPGRPPGVVEVALRAEYLLRRPDSAATARADSLVTRALSGGNTHPRLELVRAEIARRRGDLEAARSIAAATLATVGTAEAHRLLGLVALSRGDLADADRQLQRAMDLAPGSPEPYHIASYVAAYRGDLAGAVGYMERARALDPVGADLVADAGFIHLWAGELVDAEERCRASLALDPSHRAAARCLVEIATIQGDAQLGESAALMLLRLPGTIPAPGESAVDAYWAFLATSTRDGACAGVARGKAQLVRGSITEGIASIQEAAGADVRCALNLLVDPILAPARDHPEIRRLLRGYGLDPGSGPA